MAIAQTTPPQAYAILARHADAVYLDVRTPEEFTAGHPAGARNVPVLLMDAATGVFVPGGAGPNPARRMSANNVGNLKVIAEVADGGESVKGEGRLIVAAPRWNNPPIP